VTYPPFIIMEERDLTKNPFVILRWDGRKSSYIYLAETTSWLRANSIVVALENNNGCSV
jgi:hypothetical protein